MEGTSGVCVGVCVWVCVCMCVYMCVRGRETVRTVHIE